MKSGHRFDLRALRATAGDTVYARGEAYFRDGAVTIVSIRPGRVVAQVSGSEDYRTELNGGGTDIDGSCSCRAFEDHGFCKHMVAAALAANATVETGADGPDATTRIREHLKSRSVDALVDMILGLAEHDPALFRKLDLAAAALQGDEKAIEARLRTAIDRATRIRGFIEYAEVPGWAEGVSDAINALDDLAAGGHAGLVLKLAEHAIARIESAVAAIDDSDGDGGALLERVRDLHMAACIAARPDPVKLARYLFEREVRHPYDTFYGSAGLYEEALGEAGLAEFRSLAEAAWSKLPARMGRKKATADDLDSERLRLLEILDGFAERAGNVEVRIALRARDLSSPWRYQQLAQFCLDEGRPDEALKHAEEGMWIFEDEGLDGGLAIFVYELLSKKGRSDEAVALLWRLFEAEASLDLYQRLAELEGKSAFGRAVSFLKGRPASGKRVVKDWSGDLLIHVLAYEEVFDEAWATVRERGASMATKMDLAKASERFHPREAVAAYAENVEELANRGVYEEAVKLIKRIAKLQDAAEHASYVSALKMRHQRKRNFMKLLA
jgi:tetratricopeptide (TPR) repeat protein